MKVGTRIDSRSLMTVPENARFAEKLGYDFLFSTETSQNPFLPLVLAAEHTSRVGLQTSIALAFSRSPMDMAQVAWELQALSNGRFVLGLGSQVRGHIVRRFSGEWYPPARRMREYIDALRAIWDCWQNDTKLDFRGTYYNFNLMPPFFRPEPTEYPGVEVYVAAVNANMLTMAGEVCDGVVLHPFSTSKYVKEVILPHLQLGASKAGRMLSELDIVGDGLIVTGRTVDEVENNKEAAKSRIAFYASTKTYAPVMSVHGWDDTAEQLYGMSTDGRWSDMGELITDEMLEAFATIGTYDELLERLKDRYAGYASSVRLSIPVMSTENVAHLRALITSLKTL